MNFENLLEQSIRNRKMVGKAREALNNCEIENIQSFYFRKSFT